MWPACARDTQGLALLQAAKQEPEDRLCRRVLADWLEEQGEAEVAACLRQSLDKPQEWIEFPKAIRERWWPWNGCQDGWLGVQNPTKKRPDSPWFCCLRFREYQIGPKRAAALAASPRWAQLKSLHLARNQIGSKGAAALAASPHLAQLTHLNLEDNQIGPKGAAALAASPHLAQLTSLDLARNQIGDSGTAALAASPHLAQLTSLHLRDNHIGPKGAAALATLEARGVDINM